MFGKVFLIICAYVGFNIVPVLMASENSSQQNPPSTNTEKRLHVGIYYESLCPDSVDFIKNQLEKEYDHFKDKIDVSFVPFGKAQSENDGRDFYCQHGPAECTGNRVQSCVLDLIGDQDERVKYVACQMNRGIDYFNPKCPDLVNLTYTDYSNCLLGARGVELQLQAEQDTQKIRKPYPSFIPTIVYNNVYSAIKSRRSLRELGNVLCQELKDGGDDRLPTKCTPLQ